MEGVLWRVADPQERKRLRAREGAPYVYREKMIQIRVAGGWTWAFTFQLIRPFHIDIAPACLYLQLLFDSPVSSAYKEGILQRRFWIARNLCPCRSITECALSAASNTCLVCSREEIDIKKK